MELIHDMQEVNQINRTRQKYMSVYVHPKRDALLGHYMNQSDLSKQDPCERDWQQVER